MTDEEFELFVSESYDWLEERQNKLHSDYGIGEYEAYWYDQESGLLQFKNNGKVELSFPFIDIGSWNNEKNSFMWAWANESVVKERRSESAVLKALGDRTGFEIFTMKKFECDESMAWKIAAMGARELDSIGVYRVPHGNIELFLAIMPPN